MQTSRYDLDIMKVGLGNKNCVPFLCRLVQDFSNPSNSDSKASTPSLEYLQNRNNTFLKILWLHLNNYDLRQRYTHAFNHTFHL